MDIGQNSADHVVVSLAGAMKKKMECDSSGHDWWHVHRVFNLACKIAMEEKADLFIVQLAALLHDVADPKFHDGDEEIGALTAGEMLQKLGVDREIILQVQAIVRGVSFKGRNAEVVELSKEGQIVQDADRLDAIGAIGIARAFAYGGKMGKVLHDPEQQPAEYQSVKEYYLNQSSTINHFYEKLLLLKNLMNTVAGKRIAEARQGFMEEFLNRFYLEWEGKI